MVFAYLQLIAMSCIGGLKVWKLLHFRDPWFLSLMITMVSSCVLFQISYLSKLLTTHTARKSSFAWNVEIVGDKFSLVCMFVNVQHKSMSLTSPKLAVGLIQGHTTYCVTRFIQMHFEVGKFYTQKKCTNFQEVYQIYYFFFF